MEALKIEIKERNKGDGDTGNEVTVGGWEDKEAEAAVTPTTPGRLCSLA